MDEHIDVLFPALQRTLSDEADQVVQQCLVVIAEVVSSPTAKHLPKEYSNNSGNNTSPYYNKFIISLLNLFSFNKRLLDERGSFIIRYTCIVFLMTFLYVRIIFFRQLCILLNAEDIYKTLAKILLQETNLKFASLMVEHLNMILLTSSELFELRNRLKDLNSEVAIVVFFLIAFLTLFYRKIVRYFVVCIKLGATIQLQQCLYAF